MAGLVLGLLDLLQTVRAVSGTEVSKKQPNRSTTESRHIPFSTRCSMARGVADARAPGILSPYANIHQRDALRVVASS
jgi:hypothetical protein